MITIEVGGVPYNNLISIGVNMSVGQLVRGFVFVIARPNNAGLPFKGGERVRIRADSNLLCDGYIDSVTPSYSRGAHTITMQGRSRAQDLVDSTLLPITISAKTSLVKIIELVIAQIGLDLTVKNNASGLADFNPDEDRIGAEAGEGAFDFIDRLARKRQVLLTSDAAGNIIISRSGTKRNTISIRNKIGGDTNILSGDATYNTARRFNRYIVASQLNTTTPSFKIDANNAVDQRSTSTDTDIRARQMVLVAEKASSKGEAQKRADWQNNIARAKSRVYNCTVQGVNNSAGEYWEPNVLQAVADDFASIDELLLVDTVAINQDRSNGTTTSLSLVDKNAYDIAPAPKETKKNALFK